MAHLSESPCRPCGDTASALWRGPNGYTLLSWQVDFDAGGASRLGMRAPDGRDFWVDGVCLEIAEPERVVFSGDVDLAGQSPHELPCRVTFRRA
jgi:uncharacterized protein YndB with AHSA1/START domain